MNLKYKERYLTKKERNILDVIAKTRPNCGIDLARACSMPRSSLYESINKLKDLGLINEIINSGGIGYRLGNENKLIDLIQAEISSITELFEELHTYDFKPEIIDEDDLPF
jgi:biotin operon repressor